MLGAKNYQNWLMFCGVIQRKKWLYFSWPPCI